MKQNGKFIFSIILLVVICISIAFSMISNAAETVNGTVLQEGIYQIKNVRSGKYMDVQSEKTLNNTNIIQCGGNGGENQRFYIKPLGDNNYYIIPMIDRYKRIDVYTGYIDNGTEVNIYNENNGPNQKFKISKAASNNYYSIKTGNTNYSKCLTVQNASMSDNAKIIQYDYKSDNELNSNDHWYFELVNATQVFQNGYYWLSNTSDITSGEPRVMDARGPSYSSETVIQQWRSSGPGSDNYYAQTWKLTYINDGYYTIASSKKPDMYISWYGSEIKLEQRNETLVKNYDNIQWKIEGYNSTGLTITNKRGDSYALTAPISTSSGVALGFSNKTASNNNRNKWTLNRIDNVYTVNIVSSSKMSSSSASLNDSGHGFIVFENFSTSMVNFGHISVHSGEKVSIGTFGNKISHIGIWYNLELFYKSNNFTFDNCVSLNMLINTINLNNINDYIDNNDTWSLLNNCSTFAQGLWYTIGGVSVPMTGIDTPESLILSIKNYNWYVNDFPLYEPEYQGYYNKSNKTFIKLSKPSLLNGSSSSSDSSTEEYYNENEDVIIYNQTEIEYYYIEYPKQETLPYESN